MAQPWSGTAAFTGGINLGADGGLCELAQSAALLAGSGNINDLGYVAGLFSDFIAVLESEADAGSRATALSMLLAYYAVVTASSVQDRRTPPTLLAKVYKDTHLFIRHLYGDFGVGGLPIDRPSADQLGELEGVTAAARVAAGLLPLPGTEY